MSVNIASDATFAQDVIVASYEKPVLVDFTATWCPPCKMYDPILAEVASDYAANLSLIKVDVDENQQVVQDYGIMGMPTVILFKDGEPVKRLVGYMPKARLVAQLQSYL